MGLRGAGARARDSAPAFHIDPCRTIAPLTGRHGASKPGRPVGRMAARREKSLREESPGSMEARCRVTPGGGDPRESATESIPPGFAPVRVKGCGKSAPRRRQRGRHGKPHREQNRIGTTRTFGSRPAFRPLSGLVARDVRQRTSQMNGHPAVRARWTEPGLQADWHCLSGRHGDLTVARVQATNC